MTNDDRKRIEDMARSGRKSVVISAAWLERVLRPMLPPGEIVVAVVEWLPSPGQRGSDFEIRFLNRDRTFWYRDEPLLAGADLSKYVRLSFEAYLGGENGLSEGSTTLRSGRRTQTTGARRP
jgi:hypothetical protein